MGQYFRGALKMNLVGKRENPGSPPPVLSFYAHGIYTNVPVL